MDKTRKEVKIMSMQQIARWRGQTFQSSTGLTTEFASFARDYRRFINSVIPDDYELVGFNRGHFYVSGFIKHKDKYAYFSCSDVRYFPEEWSENILIRTANGPKDYTGGGNRYVNLDTFGGSIVGMLA